MNDFQRLGHFRFDAKPITTVAWDLCRIGSAWPVATSSVLHLLVEFAVANHPGERGYDAGKKIRGRKRHLVVDTLGLILGVVVTAADVSDRAGALAVLPAVLQAQPRLEQLWADAGSAGGTLAEQLRAHAAPRDLRLDIIKRSDPAPKGFQVQPKRWIVERTFGWLMQARSLARDYETKPASSQAMIFAQASRIMLRRLSK